MGRLFSKKIMISASSVFVITLVIGISYAIINNDKQKSLAGNADVTNEVMLQGFEWYAQDDGTYWSQLKDKISLLSDNGFDSIWLPPAYKADSTSDEGYDPYDLYDLGEFEQAGAVRTKYGTKEEYLELIEQIHAKDMFVYADIALDHLSGADAVEHVEAYICNNESRGKIDSVKPLEIGAWCTFNYINRSKKYSDFTWDASCFDGVNWDDIGQTSGIYRFTDKSWDWQVDTEQGNSDYSEGADIDYDNEDVVTELKKWGKWYTDIASLDGFRLDSVNNIKYTFYNDWLEYIRSKTDRKLFAVADFWSDDIEKISTYINTTDGSTRVFDVPLHYNFYEAGNSSGGYDMKKIYEGTLTSINQSMSVTFVDNHISQPGQENASYIAEWFKPIAYTTILTRQEGYPCVFYGDYYGTNDGNITSFLTVIDTLMEIRKKYMYGASHDYFNDTDIVGWTFEGDTAHENSGMAAVITDSRGGSQSMYVGMEHVGETWYDATGNRTDTVTITENGYGTFMVNDASYSVWVKQK